MSANASRTPPPSPRQAAVMSDNRAKLGERGERLEAMSLKSGKLEDEASNFADLATQLKAAAAGRKWWQL